LCNLISYQVLKINNVLVSQWCTCTGWQLAADAAGCRPDLPAEGEGPHPVLVTSSVKNFGFRKGTAEKV